MVQSQLLSEIITNHKATFPKFITNLKFRATLLNYIAQGGDTIQDYKIVWFYKMILNTLESLSSNRDIKYIKISDNRVILVMSDSKQCARIKLSTSPIHVFESEHNHIHFRHVQAPRTNQQKQPTKTNVDIVIIVDIILCATFSESTKLI